MTFVFWKFNLRLWAFNQFVMLSSISFTSLFRVSSFLHGKTTDISSANSMLTAFIILGKSFIYIKNSRHPSTLPWGIELFMVIPSDLILLILPVSEL